MDVKKKAINAAPGVAQIKTAKKGYDTVRTHAPWLPIKTTAACLALAGAGVGIGLYDNMLHASKAIGTVEQEATAKAPTKSKIVDYDAQLQSLHLTGFTANVSGSKATIQSHYKNKVLTWVGGPSIDVKLPFSHSETFTGDVKTDFCLDPVSEHVHYDEKAQSVSIAIAKKAIGECTQVDPTNFSYHPGGSLLNIPGDVTKAIMDDLPYVDNLPIVGGLSTNKDKVAGALQGASLLQAYEQDAEKCGPIAWTKLKGAFVADVKSDALRTLGVTLPESAVTLTLGGEPAEADDTSAMNFTSDWSSKISAMKVGNTPIDFDAKSLQVSTCTEATNFAAEPLKVIVQPPVVSYVTDTPSPSYASSGPSSPWPSASPTFSPFASLTPENR